jgi:hypothetical protein
MYCGENDIPPYFDMCLYTSLCLNFFHLLAQNPNLEKFSIY